MGRYSQKKRKSPKRSRGSGKSRKVKPHQAEAIAQLADSVALTAVNEQKIEDVKEDLEKLQKRKGMKDILPYIAAAVVAMGVIGGGANAYMYEDGRVRKAYGRSRDYVKSTSPYKYASSGAAYVGSSRPYTYASTGAEYVRASPGNVRDFGIRNYRKMRYNKDDPKRYGGTGDPSTGKEGSWYKDSSGKWVQRTGMFRQYSGKYSSGMAGSRRSAQVSRASQRRRRRRSRSRSRSRSRR